MSPSKKSVPSGKREAYQDGGDGAKIATGLTQSENHLRVSNRSVRTEKYGVHDPPRYLGKGNALHEVQ